MSAFSRAEKQSQWGKEVSRGQTDSCQEVSLEDSICPYCQPVGKKGRRGMLVERCITLSDFVNKIKRATDNVQKHCYICSWRPMQSGQMSGFQLYGFCRSVPERICGVGLSEKSKKRDAAGYWSYMHINDILERIGEFWKGQVEFGCGGSRSQEPDDVKSSRWSSKGSGSLWCCVQCNFSSRLVFAFLLDNLHTVKSTMAY